MDFPRVEMEETDIRVSLPSTELRTRLGQVALAMAQQDVRYFCDGMLFEFTPNRLRRAATNGQRLAQVDHEIEVSQDYQAIVPRKAVQEIVRLLKGDGTAVPEFYRNHLCVEVGDNRLTTRLTDATLPGDEKATPARRDSHLISDRKTLNVGLSRTSILANGLYRNVKLSVEPVAESNEPCSLYLAANNPLQEEAEEYIDVEYTG
jgi:DNA polymerase-3 subunit beta